MFRLHHKTKKFKRPINIISEEVRLLLTNAWLPKLELHGVYPLTEPMEPFIKWLNQFTIKGPLDLVLSGHYYYFYVVFDKQVFKREWPLGYMEMTYDNTAGATVETFVNFNEYLFNGASKLYVPELRMSFMNARFELLESTVKNAKTETLFLSISTGSSLFNTDKYIGQPDENTHIVDLVLDLREFNGIPDKLINYILASLGKLENVIIIRTERCDRHSSKRPKLSTNDDISDEYSNVNFIFVTVSDTNMDTAVLLAELSFSRRELYLIRQALPNTTKFLPNSTTTRSYYIDS
ncbi:unnamed protein product [Bursaphelenchus okinawaensis]|uniref:Uncharacterized protein n=1 Tax=Bursaphelenchus okinawaensis TaxID=465554 RepID=A0A811K6T8_9BILA|nr:unnamed protein product [Bursaphelenchus okinawaensis]CAG9092622.1 unnamed protein product [Bursaphelenchus okinawaensis]